MVTLGRPIQANVMWNSEALCQRLAYGHQTGILLERI
jgi:hypothetical protein